MKVLLIGPCPPPHGGVSVHVSRLYELLRAAGVTCRILNTHVTRPGLFFLWSVLSYSSRGWILHLHTNGHNLKSWLVALGCGIGGRLRGGAILTLHSGMAPAYLAAASSWRRRVAAVTCSLYRQIVCVSPEIQQAVDALGVRSHQRRVLPAYLSTERAAAALDLDTSAWLARHRPLFSTALFFRPEYGFELLLDAVARLSRTYPSLGCVVMGGGQERMEAAGRIRSAGLDDHILLLGDVDHRLCLTFLGRSDLFLRPTLADGDSLSVREALSLGTPVVASRVGSRPAEAVLFEPGSVDDMIAKIQATLDAERPISEPLTDCIGEIIEIYRNVTGAESTLCPN